MAINILVVITLGKFAKQACEAATAGVIHTSYAPTVTTPVAKTLHILVQFVVVGIDRTALAHGHVMGRIE